MICILYTEEEGGSFHYIAKNNDKETKQLFDDTIKTGRMKFRNGDRIVDVAAKYIVLLKDIDNYDFVLSRKRK